MRVSCRGRRQLPEGGVPLRSGGVNGTIWPEAKPAARVGRGSALFGVRNNCSTTYRIMLSFPRLPRPSPGGEAGSSTVRDCAVNCNHAFGYYLRREKKKNKRCPLVLLSHVLVPS
ncbi:hypothetical protein MTO96_001338 [Rhipicephalus appendiculatus]